LLPSDIIALLHGVSADPESGDKRTIILCRELYIRVYLVSSQRKGFPNIAI
jgi:hypothetical protein